MHTLHTRAGECLARRPARINHGPTFLLALLVAVPCLVFLAGCGGGHRDKQQQETADLAVPECDAYAQRAQACFHRADLEGTIPTRAHDEAERDRMRASCTLNLQRLSAACR
jgi:hypothetical protein